MNLKNLRNWTSPHPEAEGWEGTVLGQTEKAIHNQWTWHKIVALLFIL
jgi:hypothetical protein